MAMDDLGWSILSRIMGLPEDAEELKRLDFRTDIARQVAGLPHAAGGLGILGAVRARSGAFLGGLRAALRPSREQHGKIYEWWASNLEVPIPSENLPMDLLYCICDSRRELSQLRQEAEKFYACKEGEKAHNNIPSCIAELEVAGDRIQGAITTLYSSIDHARLMDNLPLSHRALLLSRGSPGALSQLSMLPSCPRLYVRPEDMIFSLRDICFLPHTNFLIPMDGLHTRLSKEMVERLCSEGNFSRHRFLIRQVTKSLPLAQLNLTCHH